MPIPSKDDGDPFRAMGYVCVYAAYVEENVGECFQLLRNHDPQLRGDPWNVSGQLDSCLRAVTALPRHAEWPELTALLRTTKGLIRERNLAIHSPLYGNVGGANVRRARVQADQSQNA